MKTDTQRAKPGSFRAIAAASIGNALEWYDFAVYAFFAVYLAKNFFPGGSETVELVKSFLAFGLGFVIRPLGAILIGRYGDRHGRKAALMLTIGVMAVGTGVIAFAPTYTAIGVGAPLLLLAGRVLQGFSAGGEIGSAAAFLVEHAPPERKGFYASWLQASMAFSNIMGALVAYVVSSSLTTEQIGAWGWRIPFIVGLLIVPLGLVLRRTLDETPEFKAESRAHDVAHSAPIKDVFSEYLKELLIGTLFCVLWAICVYTLIIYMPTYMQRVFGFKPDDTFRAALIGNVFMTVGCVASGLISDRVGRRSVLVGAAVAMLIAVLPLLQWLKGSPTPFNLVLVQTAFCLMVAFFVGVAPAALASLFPTKVRATGMSLTYNAAVTVFGGFAPALLTWFSSMPGGVFAPAYYVMCAAAAALLALLIWPKQTAQ
jgi:MFS transporter, MHS family, proline/betaine transporter